VPPTEDDIERAVNTAAVIINRQLPAALATDGEAMRRDRTAMRTAAFTEVLRELLHPGA
jgi:hypothetical protein